MKPRSGFPPACAAAPAGVRTRDVRLAAAAVFLVAVAVFLNGIGGVFVFDDESTILENRSIREPGNVAAMFTPPVDASTLGRPLANATFALNYAVSGLEPWSYHAVNILIHALAAVVLFGLVRRILLLPALRGRCGENATGLALATAVLWAVHPLQTESVTYVVQRVEALAGLFYLLTVYGFVRSVDSPCGARWWGVSVAACWLGVASKEIIVSAPLVVLLCDRTWIAGGFAEALRRRAWFYAGLAASWVLLAALIWGAANRAGTAGFGTASAWHYLLTQCGAIVHYLRLAAWPAPLVFDYGDGLVGGLAAVWPQALGLVALAAAVAVAVARRSPWGVAGFWFFAILAPSSSVVPVVTQTMAEHRMYLPLAAVIVAGVVAAQRWTGRRAWVLFVVAGLVLAGLTVRRNGDYGSQVALWADTVAKRPENWRARNNLGLALAEAGRPAEALVQFDAALGLVPGTATVINNRVPALLALGRGEEALAGIDAVLAQAPEVAEFHDTRGLVLLEAGRWAEAAASLREALRLKPELPDAHLHLGMVFSREGKRAEARACWLEALRLRPGWTAAREALARQGEAQE